VETRQFRAGLEFGLRRPGTVPSPHTAAGQFVGKRFGERQHIRFGRVIHRISGPGNMRPPTPDSKSTAASVEHGGKKSRVRWVNAGYSPAAFRVGLRCPIRQRVHAIRSRHCSRDIDRFSLQPIKYSRGSIRRGEILNNDVNGHAMPLAKLSRQVLKLLFISGDDTR